MLKNANITIATYNTQSFFDSKKIKANLHYLLKQKNIDIVCLQEVINKNIATEVIQEILVGWKYVYFHDQTFDKHHGLATFWNPQHGLQLIETKQLLLPKLDRLTNREKKIVPPDHTNHKRGALITSFNRGGKIPLKIANIHLDLAGGNAHRVKQLAYILQHMNDKNTEAKIICGDFNTLGLTQLQKQNMIKRQNKIQNVLGEEYSNIFPDLLWTSDATVNISANKLHYSVTYTLQFLRFLHLHVYQKLDYIFAKGIQNTSAEMVSLKGSDHFPLLATFI